MKARRRRRSVGGMDTLAYYTVELASPREGWTNLPHLSSRARQATEEMRREGIQVRFLRSVFVPEDETCFYLYEAASAEAVREAARRAALQSGRVAEALTDSGASG